MRQKSPCIVHKKPLAAFARASGSMCQSCCGAFEFGPIGQPVQSIGDCAGKLLSVFSALLRPRMPVADVALHDARPIMDNPDAARARGKAQFIGSHLPSAKRFMLTPPSLMSPLSSKAITPVTPWKFTFCNAGRYFDGSVESAIFIASISAVAAS